nr:unnamed protein product [Callosobruchus analis]
MEGEDVMDLELGEEIQIDSPRREEEATAGQRRGGSTQGVALEAGDGISNVPLGDLVQVLLADGLTSTVTKIAKQQAMLVAGELSDAPVASTSSGRSDVPESEASGSGRRAMLLGSEMLGYFDPEDPDMNVDSRTWDQWKEALRTAFPRRRDFAQMLEEMLARRKSTGETMSTYYHEKLALCSRVGIAGEDAVSCIIRGLPAELRPNAQAARCRTQQALYNDILAGLESYGRVATHSKAAATRVSIPSKAVAPVPRERARCYNCQQITIHLSRDCPMPLAQRCRGCGDRGHMVDSCPKRRGVGGRGSSDQRTVATKAFSVHWRFRREGVYIDTRCEANLMAMAERLGLEIDPNGAGLWRRPCLESRVGEL